MKLITFFAGADTLKNFKAPKGLQYLIESVLFVVTNINAPTFLNAVVKDFNVEERQPGVLNIQVDALAIYGWELDLGNNVSTTNPQPFQVININHKSKYCSIQTDHGGDTTNIHVIIYGELVPISRTEAIFEWFRKGR